MIIDFLTYITPKVLTSPKSKKSAADLYSLQRYDFLMKNIYGIRRIIFNGGFGHFFYLLSGHFLRSRQVTILLQCIQTRVSDSECVSIMS